MKQNLTNPVCPLCKAPTTLVGRTTRYRRGEQVLAVPTRAWACSAGCPDPTSGEAPFTFVDQPLAAWNDEHAGSLWLDHFGSPMPPSRQGRRPGEARCIRVPVMLTPTEVARLDKLRGDATRSAYLRLALRSKDRRAG